MSQIVQRISRSSLHLPKLVAFDLDGTVWTPDMYQLWGGGAPFSVVDEQRELSDRSNQPVRLLGIAGQILHSLRHDPAWTQREATDTATDADTDTGSYETIVAWASCTDEPGWADECLRKFKSSPDPSSSAAATEPVPLHTLAHSSQVYKANKGQHMRKLQQEYPHIAFSEMLFFDNERHNTAATAKLGVVSLHCPHGLTAEAWEEGLRLYANTKEKR